MRPVPLVLAAILTFAAGSARAAPFPTLVAEGTSNVFTGDGIQAISLAEVDFSQTATVVGVAFRAHNPFSWCRLPIPA